MIMAIMAQWGRSLCEPGSHLDVAGGGWDLGGLWGPSVSVQIWSFKGFTLTLRPAPGLTLLGQDGTLPG